MNREILLTQNLHWLGQSLTKKTQHRQIFDQIYKELDYRPMVFLTGMRRVGKSTLIKQLIEKLILEKNIKPEQILFWEFHSQSTIKDLEDLIQVFLDETADLNKDLYIFLDEVKFIPNYENILKLYYDRYENLHFGLTGSLSFSYKNKMQESLAGRFVNYKLFPISFLEYLQFSNQNEYFEKWHKAKLETNLNLKEGLARELNPIFKTFLGRGRFPDTIVYEQNEQVKSYLGSVITQSLNQDSVDYFKITKPREINFLYQYLVKNNGGEVSLDRIGKNLGLSWQTTSNYIDILELLGLIYTVNNTDNPLKLSNSRKKIYTNSAFSLSFEDQILDTQLGFAVESYVLERFLEQKKTIHFFRERDVEVDLIDYKSKTAYEVKFRSQIQEADFGNLLKISQKFSLSPKVITLFQTVAKNPQIEYLPACLI